MSFGHVPCLTDFSLARITATRRRRDLPPRFREFLKRSCAALLTDPRRAAAGATVMHCLLKCGGHTGPLAWKEETETAVGGGQQVVGAHVMILKYQTYFLWETTTTTTTKAARRSVGRQPNSSILLLLLLLRRRRHALEHGCRRLEGAQKPRDNGDDLALESREKGDKVKPIQRHCTPPCETLTRNEARQLSPDQPPSPTGL